AAVTTMTTPRLAGDGRHREQHHDDEDRSSQLLHGATSVRHPSRNGAPPLDAPCRTVGGPASARRLALSTGPCRTYTPFFLAPPHPRSVSSRRFVLVDPARPLPFLCARRPERRLCHGDPDERHSRIEVPRRPLPTVRSPAP